MPVTLQTYLTGTNVLTPLQFPELARLQAGSFDFNLSITAGQVLAVNTNNARLCAFLGSGTAAVAVGLNQYTLATDASGNVFYNGGTNGSTINPPLSSSAYWVKGDFDVNQLTGWNATALSTLTAKYTTSTNAVHIP